VRVADLPPEEIRRATKKNDRQDARIAKSGGVTSRSRALAAEWHPLLDARLRTVLKARSDDPDLSVFLDRASKLGSEKLSACILQGALQDIQHEKNTYLKAALRVGQNIYLECFAAGLFKGYPKRLAQTIKRQNKGKPNRTRALVARELYKMPDWSEGHLAKAGTWGIDQLCAAIPDAFDIEERNIKIGSNKQALEKILLLTPDAIEGAERSVAELIRRNPLWLPKPEAPSKWEDWTKGGTSDHRLDGTLSIVRSRNNYTARAVRKAIRDGTMRPTLDALNALQAVRWKINRPVLDVLRACDLQKIKVDGLPKSSISDRVVFIADIETAEELTAHDCFYTAMNLDWRGRVYGVPHFNFQRDNRVR
jgi:DNA-directed RNA polymerase, mitochondrial